MDAHRLMLLARIGAVLFADEPSGGSGGGTPAGSAKGGSDEETPDGEDDSGGDDEDDSDGDDEDDEDEDDKSDSGEGDGFKPITSKEEFNRILGKRLQRERAKFADYEDLKQQVSSQEATISDLREKLGKQEMQEKRTSIASEAGVPENLLRGATEEELKAHAEELKAAFNKTEEDEQTGARRNARSPHTGTGQERPAPRTQETGRESARAYLDKNKRKDQV